MWLRGPRRGRKVFLSISLGQSGCRRVILIRAAVPAAAAAAAVPVAAAG